MRKYHMLNGSKSKASLNVSEFFQKIVLSKAWKRPCDFENSLQFLRYYEKLKNSWYAGISRTAMNFWG